MIRLRAYSKINLTLDVLGRRPDGYHEIDSLVQTTDLCDILTLERAGRMSLDVEGYEAPADERNLVWQACVIVLKRYGLPGGVAASIKKRIPPQAGLGGGSSDAAAALIGTCRLFGVEPRNEELFEMAGLLGSDVPFFLVGGTARIMGRGERVLALPDGPRLELVIVWPGFGIPTEEAYRRLDSACVRSAKATPKAMEAISSGDAEGLLASMSNDFQSVVFADHPELQQIALDLGSLGARATLLCGSGSAVFGVFGSAGEAEAARGRMMHRSDHIWAASTVGRMNGEMARCSLLSL